MSTKFSLKLPASILIQVCSIWHLQAYGEFFLTYVRQFFLTDSLFFSLVGISENSWLAFWCIYFNHQGFFFLKWNLSSSILNSQFSVKYCHMSPLFMAPDKAAVRCIEYKPFGQSGSIG